MKEKITSLLKELAIDPMDHKTDCYCGLCKVSRVYDLKQYTKGYWDGVFACIDIINRFKFD